MDLQVLPAWSEALPGDACGPDLEYDPGFMELGQAAAGKPETQFGPAEPPSWPQVRELSESLFGQTRDLRVALLWSRAAVNLAGLEGLGPALSLLHDLMANFWDEVHPRPDPDDGDTFARVSLLSSLNSMDGFLGDVRGALLLTDRRLGGLRVRDTEVALDRLAPRADDNHYNVAQIEGMLGETPELTERLTVAVTAAQEALSSLKSLMDARFGSDGVELKQLQTMLSGVKGMIPGAAPAEEDAADEAGAPSAGGGSTRRGGGLGSIESRQDAVRAINAICAFLERTEPANPAQLMLRRAERMIDKNFIQLVRDLAPDAVNEVARILGVDPDSFADGNSY